MNIRENEPNNFRACRQLLGLTRLQVSKRMSIGLSSLESIESLNGSNSWRSRRIYYACWLREYARFKHPQVLPAIDSILSDGHGAPDYLNLPEPRIVPRTAKRPVLFIEEDIQFLSCMSAARYCKEHYSERIGPKVPRTIAMGIGQVCDGAMDDYKGLHFKEIIVR